MCQLGKGLVMKVGKLQRHTAVLITAFTFFGGFHTAAIAEDIFPEDITSSSWAQEGQCSSKGIERFFIFSGGFRSSEMLWASTDSSRQNSTFYLFLECSVSGAHVTYMGSAQLSKSHLEIDLTEYRGASRAPNIYLKLEKCQ